MVSGEVQKVRELMDESGYGMLDCRLALQENDWGKVKAGDWLNKMDKVNSGHRLITKKN